MVIVLLFVLYYGRVIIRSIGQRSIKRHEQTINGLKDQLKRKIEELKKKTAYDTTKNLIDKYSLGDKQDGKVRSPADRAKMLDAKRRQTMPNFAGSPASQSGLASQASPMMSNAVMARQPGGLIQQQQQQQQQSNAYMGAGVVKLPGRSASVQPMDSPIKGKGTRPWLDKLVDQLVGDVGGADDRYALICRFCYAHNGLVLEEEINDIQYNCPKCGKFNPSLRTLRLQNRVESQQILHTPMAGRHDSARHYGNYEDFSDYDYGSSDGDNDSYKHYSEEDFVEDKSIQADVSGEFGTPSPQRTAHVGNLGLIDDNDNEKQPSKDESAERINSLGDSTAKASLVKHKQQRNNGGSDDNGVDDDDEKRSSVKDQLNKTNAKDQKSSLASVNDNGVLTTPKRGKKATEPLLNAEKSGESSVPVSATVEQSLKSPGAARKTSVKTTTASGKRKANKSSKVAE
ncbi:hypothetical protein J3B02_001349 [Coemansia erecta]|nr:hypothetical protein J3B02_001349 [Coemansia erecta]